VLRTLGKGSNTAIHLPHHVKRGRKSQERNGKDSKKCSRKLVLVEVVGKIDQSMKMLRILSEKTT
jgi:hypothetical protein